MKKRLRTVDWLIYVTAFLDIVVFILLLIIPSCNRNINFVQPEADTVESDSDVSQALEVGQGGDLKITLLWDFPADIDLHILQPNGREIFYRNPVDRRTGGYLDVDNRAGGNGSAENVYYSSPLSGRYKVYLKYYSASSESSIAGSGNCRVVVFQEGCEAKTYNVEMNSVGTERYVTTVFVQ